MAYIEILTTSEPIRWQYKNEETGQVSDSVFWIKPLEDGELNPITRKHTTREQVFNKRTRGMEFRETLDGTAWGYEVLDLALVRWEGVKAYDPAVPIGERPDLPCTPETRRKLPTRIKLDLIRAITGREAPEAAFDGAPTRRSQEGDSKNS